MFIRAKYIIHLLLVFAIDSCTTQECDYFPFVPLGMTDRFNGILDDQVTASSSFSDQTVPYYGRLHFSDEPFVAHFDGTSWIDLRLDTPGRATQTAVDEVKFRFRTRELNGLLLYGDSSQGDYLCIELFRGRLRLNINLGTVPSSTEQTDNSVDAGSLLDDDQWHDVHIVRSLKNLNISVDRIEVWRNLSAIFIHTNMNRNLSAGGLPYFTNRRGVTVNQNFKGCIEEFVFNGVHLIRDAQRSLFQLNRLPDADKFLLRWDEFLGYPSRNPFLWWGPPLTEAHLNITGFSVGGSGQLGTSCPAVSRDTSVIMFPETQQYVVFLKIERDGGADSLQFSFQFRTLNRGGIMFYHTVDKNKNAISFGMEEIKGHLELEIILPGVNKIKNTVQNRDPAAMDGTFADGLWHDVAFTMNTDNVHLVIDRINYDTRQKTTRSLSFDRVSFIGGGRPQRYGFQGCMRAIRINSIDVIWDELDPSSRHQSIMNGSCLIQDRCSPNPCKHEAPCHQNGDTFFCSCGNTGYSGAVCHQSEYFTSCAEAGLFYALRNPFINVTIDMDGSGVLEPIEVTCDFTDPSGVITILPHDAPNDVIVDGYQAPGSYQRRLYYGRANRETLGELVRRAVRCEQSITYRCWNSFLLRLPPGGGTTLNNRAWGWWMNRKGRPRFYWGGGVPGLQKCACGVEGTCTGDSLTCNCDSAGSSTPPLVDSGLLQFKEDLPVTEVRFGDTGGINDNKYASYRVGPLRCYGDTLFDNTVTFRKLDANLELPPLYSEFAFDMSFIFRTTITDAVMMQNNGRATRQFFEVRIRNGNAIRVAFNVGNGIQLTEVTTAHWLNDNRWHVVRFERNRKQTRLIVDTQQPVVIVESLERSFRGFNFDQPLSVGTTQAFTDGFVGCLSNLLINGVVQNIRGLVESGVFTYGLSPGCRPKCVSNPCLNRGECVEHYSHYRCECGLTAYRGFICGREVGGTFQNGPMVKILLDRTNDRLGTMEEYIQVGFKTKSKRGILMEMRGAGDTNYIILKVNTNGGITIEFDVGFQRFEVTTNYDVDLSNDQHHTVHAWRTDMGTKWHLKVDDYNEVVEDFSKYLSPSADVRLDDPWVIYMGRNDTIAAALGFDGCIYAAQWNNFFPLHMAFQSPKLSNVEMSPPNAVREDLCGFIEILPKAEPLEIRPSPAIPANITPPAEDEAKAREQRIIAGDAVREDLCGFIEILPKAEPLEIRPSPAIPANITPPAEDEAKAREQRIIAGDAVREDLCGFIEILPKAEPLEIRPSPAIPANITPPAEDEAKAREQRIIAGVVTGLLLILSIIALIFFCRHFTFERGDYDTREARGASNAKDADQAIKYGHTNQPDVQGKEWWL